MSLLGFFINLYFLSSGFSKFWRETFGQKGKKELRRKLSTWCVVVRSIVLLFMHPTIYLCVCAYVLHLTGTSSDWCSRLQGGLMGRGLVASQYASTAVRAPMPTSVEVGRERKNCPRSSISGILRPLIISWACIFSIRVELSSAGQRRHFWLINYTFIYAYSVDLKYFKIHAHYPSYFIHVLLKVYYKLFCHVESLNKLTNFCNLCLNLLCKHIKLSGCWEVGKTIDSTRQTDYIKYEPLHWTYVIQLDVKFACN